LHNRSIAHISDVTAVLETVGVSTSGVSKLVTAMQASGLAKRMPLTAAEQRAEFGFARKGRTTFVSLTSDGEGAIKRFETDIAVNANAILNKISTTSPRPCALPSSLCLVQIDTENISTSGE
jgi:hypothetical protein